MPNLSNTLQIAFIQTDLIWENAPQNRTNLTQKINEISQPVDLIILPEMFTTGFTMQVETQAEPMHGETIQWLKETACKKNCVLTGSLIIVENGKYFNRLIWMRPDGSLDFFDKRHLFSLSQEPDLFTRGERKLIVDLKGWRICPLICYDLRFPIWSRNVAPYYDILIYVANWPSVRNLAWQTLLRARAIENQSYVIGVNRVGIDALNQSYSGDSVAIDPLGNYLTTASEKEETFLINFTKENILSTREKMSFLKDAEVFNIINPAGL